MFIEEYLADGCHYRVELVARAFALSDIPSQETLEGLFGSNATNALAEQFAFRLANGEVLDNDLVSKVINHYLVHRTGLFMPNVLDELELVRDGYDIPKLSYQILMEHGFLTHGPSSKVGLTVKAIALLEVVKRMSTLKTNSTINYNLNLLSNGEYSLTDEEEEYLN